jgi:hypothetical protein
MVRFYLGRRDTGITAKSYELTTSVLLICRSSVLTMHRLCGVIIIFLFQSFSPVAAQEETNYAVHANIIYHFTKYIDWPADKKSGDFIIGIIGETPLYDKLKTSTAGKQVNTQKIIIRHFLASESSFNCHILFVCEEEDSRLKKIAAITASSPVLIVSENGGLSSRGWGINFIIDQERLKLEINKSGIEKRRLNIATELLKLGPAVN